MSDVTTMRKFLGILFSKDECICVARSPFDTAIKRLADITDKDLMGAQWVSINPFDPGSSRADRNVTVFRNILLEFDDLDLAEQAQTVEAAGLPFTTQVYSGGKSYHFIISLQQPAQTYEEYQILVGWFYDIFEGVVDPTGKNPSRFTRIAGGSRPDKNKAIQELVAIKNRVSDAECDAFFATHGEALDAAEKNRERLFRDRITESEVTDSFRGRLSLRTRRFMTQGMKQGGRHKELFYCACDFKNNNFGIDEAISCLHFGAVEKSGLTEADFFKTIESAYMRAKVAPRVD